MNLKENIKYYVPVHDQIVDFNNINNLISIQTGKNTVITKSTLSDNEYEDNISYKNDIFAELTALYYIWKNCKITPYIGIGQYKRWFDFTNENPNLYIDVIRTLPRNNFFNSEYFNVFPDYENILNEYDIIMSTYICLPGHSVKDQFIHCHTKEMYDILEYVVLTKSSDIKNSFIHVMNNDVILAPHNMFITKYNIFNEYCEWLFDICFDVEQYSIQNNIKLIPRCFGFMAERLLNVFVYYKQLKMKQYPIIQLY